MQAIACTTIQSIQYYYTINTVLLYNQYSTTIQLIQYYFTLIQYALAKTRCKYGRWHICSVVKFRLEKKKLHSLCNMFANLRKSNFSQHPVYVPRACFKYVSIQLTFASIPPPFRRPKQSNGYVPFAGLRSQRAEMAFIAL